MAKDKKAKKASEKRTKGAAAPAGKPAGNGASAERPPESAEDFAHVLRRLIGARDAGARDVGSGR
jgi:hypothetical protein